jgi:UrcA family protein
VRDHPRNREDQAMSKLSLLLAIALATPAAAQGVSPDVHVAYQDLNLASPAGVRVLDRRIALAVERSCADTGHADLRTAIAIAQCRHDKGIAAAGERDRVLAAAQSATRVASAR